MNRLSKSRKSKKPESATDATMDSMTEFGVHLKLRSFSIIGEINEAQLRRFNSSMDLLEAESNEPILINLSSSGGYVDVAWAIVGRITSSKAKITVCGHGYVQSAATLVLACADFRIMSRFSVFMHHETMYSPSEGTRQRELEHIVRNSVVERKAWSRAMGLWTKKPAKYWETQGIDGKDLHLDARTCLKFGIIDKVI